MALITCENLTLAYDTGVVASGVSFALERGSYLCIVGENGSGKSTLLKVIAGFLPLTKGDILVDGKSICDMTQREAAQKITYLAQSRSIPEMTVEQLVLHGRFPHLSYPRRYSERDREIARASMEKTGVLKFCDKPLSALSGGMRQNVYIAQALTQDTDYILLDEPATYLDAESGIGLMNMLNTLKNEGKGIITVMHDLPLALTFCDSVAVIENKTVGICDTPENICKDGHTKKLFGAEILFCDEDKTYRYKYN